MNIQMNGRKVRTFRTSDSNGNPCDIQVGYRDIARGASPDSLVTDIYLSATYHGDHDEFWIVEVVGGRERRHNLKSVDHFELEAE